MARLGRAYPAPPILSHGPALQAESCTPGIRSVTVGNNTGSSATVTAITPSDTQVGDLLLIIHGNDFYTLANMPAPTVTGSPTVNAIPDAVADAGTNHGHIKAYWAEVNTAGANTVSVTETGTADEEKQLVVYVLTDWDTGGPIDDAANNFEIISTNTHEAPAVVTTVADTLMVVHDNSGAGSSTPSYTVPGSMTERYDTQFGGFSSVGATEIIPGTGDTGQRLITPATNVEYAVVTIAVRGVCAGEQPPPPPPQPVIVQRAAIREAARARSATTLPILSHGIVAEAPAVAGAGVAVQRSTTASAGSKTVSGAAVATQRDITADTAAKQGVGAGLAAQRDTTVAAGRKQASAASAIAQRDTTASTGAKAASGAGVVVNRDVTQTSTGAPAPVGSGAAVQHATTSASGSKVATGAGQPAARTASTTAGIHRALVSLTVDQRAATRSTAGVRTSSGTASAIAHTQTIAAGTRTASGVAAVVNRTATLAVVPALAAAAISGLTQPQTSTVTVRAASRTSTPAASEVTPR